MSENNLVLFPTSGRLVNMPTYLFETKLAAEVGLNEAIILQRLHFWLSRTDAGKTVGEVRWIYNTLDQWHEQFPFWSLMTVRRTLESLREKKLIFVSNLNRMKRDKTLWYTINYSNESITRNCSKWTDEVCKMNKSICSKRTNGDVQNEQTIPFKDTGKHTGQDDSAESSSSTSKLFRSEKQAVGKEKINEDSGMTQKQESRVSFLWYQQLSDNDKFEVDAYLREEIIYRNISNEEGYRRTIIRSIWRKSFGLSSDTSFYWKDGRPPYELQNGIHLQHAISRAELYACESI